MFPFPRCVSLFRGDWLTTGNIARAGVKIFLRYTAAIYVQENT